MSDDEKLRAEAIAALERQLGIFVRRVRRGVQDTAERLAPGMAPSTYRIFETVAELGPITASDIVAELRIDKALISRSLRELARLGFIERASDPNDARRTLLSATGLGVERLRAVHAERGTRLRRNLADWQLDDIRELSRLLGALTGRTAPRPTAP